MPSRGGPQSRKVVLQRWMLFGFLILTVLGVLMPRGPRSLAMQTMAFCIFAMAYDLCFGYTNQCSLGHSVFFGVGAYGVVLSLLHLQSGILLGLLIAFMAGMVVAFLMGSICVRLTEAYFVIVTALFSAIFHLLSLDMTWLTGGDDGLSVTLPDISVGGVRLSLYDPMTNYYFILVFFLASYLLMRRITEAPLGKVFISIRENEKRAAFLGYDPFRYKLAAFVLSGAFTALAGSIYALTLRYATADLFGLYWSVIPIVWCLIGGVGTLVGPCIGVALMFFFQYYVSAWWTHYLILFGVLILVILRTSRKGLLGYLLGR